MCVAVFAVGALGLPVQAAPVVRTYGPFDVTFYNNGDKDGAYSGAYTSGADWTEQQMQDLAAAISAWTSRIVQTPGRQIQLHMLWYQYSGSTLGTNFSVSNGLGGTSWTYVERVWRDGVNYSGPWKGWDTQVTLDISGAGSGWSFGSGSPGSATDFRSVLAHEIGHAVGFWPSYNKPPSDKWGQGWGTSSNPFNSAGTNLGTAWWDRNLRDSSGNQPASNSKGTPGDFNEKDNPVYWIGSHAKAYNGGTNVAIYAPSPYSDGSSLSHLDESTFPNALMSPYVNPGQVVRAPTPLEWEMMKDMGWIIRQWWNKGAGTLAWGTSGNWDYADVPDDMTEVTFTNTGLASGNTIDLGADRSVATLAFDTTVDFSIGGSTGTLTITKGKLQRLATAAGVQTIARPIALGSGAVWDIAGSGRLEVAGAINGSYSFEKKGAGTLRFSGTAVNTYSGTTTVSGGTLELAKTGANAIAGNLTVGGSGTATVRLLQGDQFADAATLTVNSSGVLDLNGQSDTVASLTVNSGGSVTTGAGALTTTGALTIGGGSFAGNAVAGSLTMTAGNISAGTLALRGNVTINPSTAAATISGILDLGTAARTFNVANGAAAEDLVLSATVVGAGGIGKSGTGSMVLGGTAANAFSGATSISSGTLLLSKPPDTAAIGGNLAISGGTVRLMAANQLPATCSIAMTGGTLDLNSQNAAVGVLSGSSGTVSLGTATLTVGGNAGDSSFAGTITGSGGLTKLGNSVLILGGANTYTGATTIHSGTVSVASILNQGASNLGLGGGVRFDQAGSIGTLQYTGATATEQRDASVAGGGTGVMDLVDPAGVVHLGSLALGSDSTLVVTGLGTLILDGASAPGGAAQGSGGSLPSTSAVRVDDGAALLLAPPGNDSALGASTTVTNNGALTITTLADEETVGQIMGTGTTTIEAGAQLTASYVRQNSLVLSGTAGSPAKLVIRPSSGGALQLGQPTALFSGSSSQVGALDSVPEPSAALMLAAGVLGLLAIRLRRRPVPRRDSSS